MVETIQKLKFYGVRKALDAVTKLNEEEQEKENKRQEKLETIRLFNELQKAPIEEEEKEVEEIESLKLEMEAIEGTVRAESEEEINQGKNQKDFLDYLINEYIDSPKIGYRMRDYHIKMVQ